MSNPPTTAPPPSPTREQLLEALDNEIAAITSERSATGWSYWAIIGALAALLWLGVDCWEKGLFVPNNVLLLTLAMSLTWDVIRSLSSSLDASPVSIPTTKNRFRPISRLLASARSSILFLLLKQIGFLVVVVFLKSRLAWCQQAYWVLLLNYALWVFIATLCLLITVLDFPPLPDTPPKSSLWFQRAISVPGNALMWFAPIATWGVVWLNTDTISAQDVRLALLATALLYLLGLAVQARIPTTRLAALQAIRQSLAFNRLPLPEAQTQADLLLIGGTLMQTLQPHFDALVGAIGQLRSNSARADEAARNLQTLAERMAALPHLDSSFPSTLAQARIAARKAKTLNDEVSQSKKFVEKKFAKFQSHFKYLAYMSPGDGEDLDSLLDHLSAISAGTQNQLSAYTANLTKAAAIIDALPLPTPQVPPASTPVVTTRPDNSSELPLLRSDTSTTEYPNPSPVPKEANALPATPSTLSLSAIPEVR